MVRTRIIFCLMFFSISPRLFSMDNDVELAPIYQPTTSADFIQVTDHNCNELVATIDDAINQKFPPKNSLKLFLNPLTEKDMLAIVNIITILHITPNKKLLYALCAKNPIFSQAIDYFSNLARKDLDNATCDNLNSLLDHKAQQPTAQLNQLIEAIRGYVINHAVSTIKYEYEVKLTEKTTIRAYTICFDKHLVAIASDDNPLRIWNLNTGNPLNDNITFNEEHTPDQICFNEDASQVATTSCKHAPRTVKIWCPKTGNLLHSLFHYYDIDLMSCYTSRSHLIVFMNQYYGDRAVQIWSINKNSVNPIGCTALPYYINNRSDKSFYCNEKNYEANLSFFGSSLCITRKNRVLLGLLQNIIAKAPLGASLDIEQLKPYLQLTDYEIGLIQAEKSKKIAAFKAISDKQKQTSEKLLTNK